MLSHKSNDIIPVDQKIKELEEFLNKDLDLIEKKELVTKANNLQDYFHSANELLIKYSKSGDLRRVKLLLEKYYANVNYSDQYGWSAIHHATKSGHVDIICYLIEICKVDPNHKCNKEGFTPLMLAAYENKLNVAEQLVKLKADVNFCNIFAKGKTRVAIDIALNKGHSEIVKFLEMSGSLDCAPKLEIAPKTKPYNLQELVDGKVDVNSFDEKGWAAIHHATNLGDLEAIHSLSKTCKANVNLAINDNVGHTSVMLAVFQNNLDIVKQLVELKADVNYTDKHGWAAIHHAAKCGHVAIIQYLIEICKVDPNQRGNNNAGCTSLMLAASENYLDVVQQLVKFKADVNIRSKYHGKGKVSRTAIQFAMYKGHLEVVKFLEKLVDPSPLQLGVHKNKPNTLQQLKMKKFRSVNPVALACMLEEPTFFLIKDVISQFDASIEKIIFVSGSKPGLPDAHKQRDAISFPPCNIVLGKYNSEKKEHDVTIDQLRSHPAPFGIFKITLKSSANKILSEDKKSLSDQLIKTLEQCGIAWYSLSIPKEGTANNSYYVIFSIVDGHKFLHQIHKKQIKIPASLSESESKNTNDPLQKRQVLLSQNNTVIKIQTLPQPQPKLYSSDPSTNFIPGFFHNDDSKQKASKDKLKSNLDPRARVWEPIPR